jgi:phosphatidylglycerol---prolipoprotein diacylglyceryl transferase
MELASLQFPNISPIALELGPLVIRWYALAYMAGLLLGWFWVVQLLKRRHLWSVDEPLTREHIDDLIVAAAIGIILGGRIGYVLFYNPSYYFSNPSEILQVWQGGMSFHGGFLGFIIAFLVYARWKKLPLGAMADLAAASVPFGLFFGRIANFVNGELFGRVTDVPWAFVFPAGGPDPRHPSQLYEAGLEGIVLFTVLTVMIFRYGALKKPGLVCGTFISGYGFARIFVEFFREPDIQIGYLAGGLTMGMILSFPMILVGGYLIWRARSRTPASA